MKIPIGQKILNLEELFEISTQNAEVEVVVDSQIYAGLDKAPQKEACAIEDYPKDDAKTGNLSKENARAIMIAKLI